MLILTGSQQPPNSTIGSGVPNALAAVNAALVDNGRLTPLFVSYSTFHNNYLLTIVPQMATAAMLGSMLPTDQLYRGRYYTFSGLGSYVANYGAFPTGAIPTQQPPITTDNYKPRARLKVFTTKKDASGADLCHNFRFSRSTPSIRHKYAICGADRDATFPVGSGWNYDGVEGYVYPPTAPQPANTVAIQRWWNPASGTFMLVPNVAADQAYWTGLGFQSDGTGILGYAYLN